MHARTTLIALLIAAGAPGALAQEEDAPLTRAPAPRQAQPEAAAERQHSPDAIAVLRAATEAVKEGFAADVRTYAEGNAMIESAFPKGEGRWVQGAREEGGMATVRYTGQGTVMNRNEPLEFDILYQPDRVSWIDHTDRTFHVERLEGGRKNGEAYTLANSAWQAEDLARGFARALEAHSLDVREPAEVDGVSCDVVAIQAKPDGDTVLWYFGHEDRLPRRNEIVIPSPINGSIRVDFTGVVAGEGALADAAWEIPVPADYEQKLARQFQPAREALASPGDTAGETYAPFPKPQASLPDWEVPDSEGSMVSPGSLRGRIAVLYFWGTWAPPCKKATPEVARLVEDYADKPVEVVSMAFREGSPDDVVAEARAQGQTWRQVPQADDAVSVLGIRVAPSVIVLGPEGELLFRSGRPKGDDYQAMFVDIRGIIDRALSGEPAPEKKEADGPAPAGAQRGVTPATPTRVAPPTKRGG